MGQPGSQFDFLGYRFWRGRTSGRIGRFIRPKSEKKLREKVKPLTRRCNGQSLPALVERLRPKLQGFFNYFKHAGASALREMDGWVRGWVRGRLRGILRKRAGLRGCGRGRDHQRWNNRYFTDLKLFSLEAAHRKERISLRKAAKC